MAILNSLMMTAAGSGDTCEALEGTMWTWGRGSQKLGYAGGGDFSNPAQIGSATDWTNKVGRFVWANHAMINSAGELWAWGEGGYGALGLGNTDNQDTPQQVGALTDWALVYNSQYTTHAIKTDGTLWSWGEGGFGRLGHNNTTSYSSPVQVGSLTDWASVVHNDNFGTALKTDGTIWAWGRNNYGQLGDGSTTNRSSPVQIGSATNWIAIDEGSDSLRALASV